MTRNATVDRLKQGIEQRDAAAISALYSDDAVMRFIDRDHPPSRPMEIRGHREIAAYYDDLCGREMTHRVEQALLDGDQLAFNLACAYPDGTRVFCSTLAELRDGRIARQTSVQAWDG